MPRDSLRSNSLRRSAIKRFYWNAGLWGLGNGLVNSSLVVYLAGNYGARGLAISFILATPRLLGVLRLVTPALIAWMADRRRFAVRTFLASGVVLGAMPFISAPDVLPTPQMALAALVSFWTAYHFFEYLGVIALWSWIGGAVPQRIRGRFVGRRGAVLNACQVAGMLAGAIGTSLWQSHMAATNQPDRIWFAYAVYVVAGAAFFILAAAPLAGIPHASASGQGECVIWSEIFAPFRDRRFLCYLAYGGMFSLANGLTASAQFIFQMRVLNISYAARIAMDASSQGLQSAVMPWIGRVIDRRGSVEVLVVSQFLVAAGMLFFLIATPEYRWWIGGAYVLWIAYAGINVTMPNLMLNLARGESYASYAGAWFAWTQLTYALATLAGGFLFDWADSHQFEFGWRERRFDHFTAFFVLGFVLRLIAAGLAARVHEPRTSSFPGE